MRALLFYNACEKMKAGEQTRHNKDTPFSLCYDIDVLLVEYQATTATMTDTTLQSSTLDSEEAFGDFRCIGE
jgi:hypothetical protein